MPRQNNSPSLPFNHLPIKERNRIIKEISPKLTPQQRNTYNKLVEEENRDRERAKDLTTKIKKGK